MYEIEQISDSLVLHALGRRSSQLAREWNEAPLMAGLDRLFREIGAYLEFVAIARER